MDNNYELYVTYYQDFESPEDCFEYFKSRDYYDSQSKYIVVVDNEWDTMKIFYQVYKLKE